MSQVNNYVNFFFKQRITLHDYKDEMKCQGLSVLINWFIDWLAESDMHCGGWEAGVVGET